MCCRCNDHNTALKYRDTSNHHSDNSPVIEKNKLYHKFRLRQSTSSNKLTNDTAECGIQSYTLVTKLT
jgi:hypothetical protein